VLSVDWSCGARQEGAGEEAAEDFCRAFALEGVQSPLELQQMEAVLKVGIHSLLLSSSSRPAPFTRTTSKLMSKDKDHDVRCVMVLFNPRLKHTGVVMHATSSGTLVSEINAIWSPPSLSQESCRAEALALFAEKQAKIAVSPTPPSLPAPWLVESYFRTFRAELPDGEIAKAVDGTVRAMMDEAALVKHDERE
jgi:hypothetical protein